jgi:hypothetical protein
MNDVLILKEELKNRNIVYTSLVVDGVDYEFYFQDKKICLFIVNEEECNEKIKDKKYLGNLKKKFKENSINLIVVYRSDLVNKFDIVFNRLMYKLGVGIIKVDARNCEVKEISYKECKKFLEKYHLMGNVMSKIRVGIYYNDELLCVTVFGKPRYNSGYDYEIGRYAVKFGYNVRGNFSKMMKYFTETYKPKSILTYHDNLYGDNSVYGQNGFVKLEDSAIGFFWYKDGQIYNRRKFWKNTLSEKLENFNPKVSAHNNMRSNGYVKIWDLGQGKYELTTTEV